eukprot:gene4190-4498_t
MSRRCVGGVLIIAWTARMLAGALVPEEYVMHSWEFSPAAASFPRLAHAAAHRLSDQDPYVDQTYIGPSWLPTLLGWAAQGCPWTQPLADCTDLGPVVAAVFLFNPLSIGGCLALAAPTLYIPLLLSSLLAALHGRYAACAACLAATALFVPQALVLSLFLGCLAKNTAGTVVLSLGLCCLGLAGHAALAGGLNHYVSSSYLAEWSVPHLHPNWGLYWYLAQEVFTGYRATFLVVFVSLPVLLVGALSIRWSGQWAVQPVIFSCGAATVLLLSPYPTLQSHAFLGALYLLCDGYSKSVVAASPASSGSGVPAAECAPQDDDRKVAQKTKTTPYVAVFTAQVTAIVVGLVFQSEWVITEHANANFFFFATLAYNVSHVYLLCQVLLSGLQLLEPDDHVPKSKTD